MEEGFKSLLHRLCLDTISEFKHVKNGERAIVYVAAKISRKSHHSLHGAGGRVTVQVTPKRR